MNFIISNYYLKKGNLEAELIELVLLSFYKKLVLKLIIVSCGTVFAIFIPVLHFVLVPAGLVVLVYLCTRFFKKPLGELILKNGICLECSAKLPEVIEVYDWPVQVKCSQCQCPHYIDR